MVTPKNDTWTLAIVGGGLTATAMLHAFTSRLARDVGCVNQLGRSIQIVVFEKSDEIGPGLPHSGKFVMPFHITNMCSRDMSVIRDVPTDFQDWVSENTESLSNQYPELNSANTCPDCESTQGGHFPRAVMGEYLKARAHEAAELGRAIGVTVSLEPRCEITEIKIEKHGLRLRINRKSGENSSMLVDRALLATGHWFPNPSIEGFIPSPWPAHRLLEQIPEGANVGVLGSSLSAIEVALTLTADGQFRRKLGKLVFQPAPRSRKAVLHSRGGLLPAVRGRSGGRHNKYLTAERLRQLIGKNSGKLRLESLRNLLEQEFEAAYGKPLNWQSRLVGGERAEEKLTRDIASARLGDAGDSSLGWQTILREVFPLAREIYINLTPSDREKFDLQFGTAFFMHAATQPLINAEKLLALLEAGIVKVVAVGKDYRVEHRDGRHDLVFDNCNGEPVRETYDYLVDARGQPRDLATNPSELVQKLTESGDVLLSAGDTDGKEVGSIRIDPQTHRVLLRGHGTGRPSETLFAVGAMTRSQMIDVSMAAGLVRSTDEVAAQLVSELVRDA